MDGSDFSDWQFEYVCTAEDSRRFARQAADWVMWRALPKRLVGLLAAVVLVTAAFSLAERRLDAAVLIGTLALAVGLLVLAAVRSRSSVRHMLFWEGALYRSAWTWRNVVVQNPRAFSVIPLTTLKGAARHGDLFFFWSDRRHMFALPAAACTPDAVERVKAAQGGAR